MLGRPRPRVEAWCIALTILGSTAPSRSSHAVRSEATILGSRSYNGWDVVFTQRVANETAAILESLSNPDE